jgi:hypothetical protein
MNIGTSLSTNPSNRSTAHRLERYLRIIALLVAYYRYVHIIDQQKSEKKDFQMLICTTTDALHSLAVHHNPQKTLPDHPAALAPRQTAAEKRPASAAAS